MHISDIDYPLLEELIAQKPIEPRDSARLLVADGAQALHHVVSDLPQFIRPGDVVVVNDTRVLPARLTLQRKTGGAAEVLLLERRSPDARLWEALVRPARKLKEGEVLEYFGKRVVRIGPRTEAGDTFVVEITDDDPLALLPQSLGENCLGARAARGCCPEIAQHDHQRDREQRQGADERAANDLVLGKA